MCGSTARKAAALCMCPLWCCGGRAGAQGDGGCTLLSPELSSAHVLLFPLQSCGKSSSQRPDSDWVGSRSCGSTIAAV